ncbi:hypothetical protein AB0E01_34725 [Nocardia vinacea]|uniref:hypothetical protein n=1 Tax=Nocardia vinacea TaxID=96468 RepID=UPI0033E4A70F
MSRQREGTPGQSWPDVSTSTVRFPILNRRPIRTGLALGCSSQVIASSPIPNTVVGGKVLLVVVACANKPVVVAPTGVGNVMMS